MIYNQSEVKRIIAEILQCDTSMIDENSGISRTYNWDSLKHVVILTTIEEYFDISIKDELFPQLLTFGDIVKFLGEYKSNVCFNNRECPCDEKCYFEKKIRFTSLDGTPLNGIYCFTNSKPKGFVLLTHGIPADKNEGGFHNNMALYLAKNGYDSFRFDFRFMGENYVKIDGVNYNLLSKEELAMNLSIHKLIEDIESAYSIALNQREGVFFEKKFGIATSCSGGILIKWMNEYKHSLKFDGVLLCCPVMDYVYECTGYSKENVNITAIREQITNNGYIPERDAMYGKDFFEEALSFDVGQELKKFGKRVIIYHGDKDQCVPVEFSIKIARDFDNVELVMIPNAKHGFSAPSTDANGNKLSKESKLIIKTKNRSDVLKSICCTIRGWNNDKH